MRKIKRVLSAVIAAAMAVSVFSFGVSADLWEIVEDEEIYSGEKQAAVKFTQVAVGEEHTAAITESGDLYLWGLNDKGQLGDGTTTTSSKPVKITVGNNEKVKAVALGSKHSAAITTNGEVYFWGNNSCGQLGDGTTTSSSTPKKLSSFGTDVKAIALGGDTSAVLLNSGKMYTFGYNGEGQLGNGTTTNSSSPVEVGLSNVESMAVSLYNAAAVLADKSLYAWGKMELIGKGNISNDTTVPNSVAMNAVSCSLGINNGLYIADNNEVFAWGANNNSELDPELDSYIYLASYIESLENASMVCTGYENFAMVRNSNLKIWGYFKLAKYGLAQYYTTEEGVLTNVKSVSQQYYHGAAVTNSGELYTWGKNINGQLGVGNTTVTTGISPVKVTLEEDHTHSYSSAWTNDSTGHWHACSCGDKSDFAAHTSDGGKVTTDPTTTSTGVRTYSCSVCSYVIKTETIPMLHSHSPASSSWESDGTHHWQVCSCGEVLNKTEHVSDGGKIEVPATQTSTGVKVYSCTVCNRELSRETLPMLEASHTHSYTGWTSDASGHWHTCSCGSTADWAAHTSDGGKVTVEATSTTTGLKTYSCSVCGCVLSTEIIPVTHTHAYSSEWTTDSSYHWHECSCGSTADWAAHTSDSGTITVQPTTSSTGVRTYKCSVCGYVLSTETIPALTEDDPDKEIKGFVERMYTQLLGRASDAKGMANHVQRLKDGQSASDIAKIFVTSSELKNKKLTNREFVRRMYVTMLDRNPDASGLNHWATALDNGCSYGYVLQGFSTSAEFTKLCQSYGINRGTYVSPENRDNNEKLTAYVSRMYTKALNRTYDINGLNNHTGRYIAGTKDAKGIAHDFIFSTEFKNRNLSNDAFINTMYATFFNRAPDAKGKANWTARMNSGWTREQVFNGFTSSTEFKNLVASFGI
ncbi:MAG: DUF4214 domain-containing protein [Huintestinicola sp.]